MSEFFERLFSGERDAILVCAAAYFALMGLVALINMYRLSRWPSVWGELLEEGVTATGLGRHDEREYRAKVQFRYFVNGKEYQGDRLNGWHMMATHNLRALLKLQFRWIERHENGRVRVYHHPKKPQKSYLSVPGWKSILVVSLLTFGSAALIWFAR